MAGIQGKLSSYPMGFNNGVSIRGLPVLNVHSNTVVWVDSNHGNDGNVGTIGLPFATIAGAIKGLQNLGSGQGSRIGNTLNGAIVMLKPYHAETLAAATTYSQAAVSIIGMYSGNTDMPTLTLTTAAGAGVVLGAADMRISGVRIVDNEGVTVAVKLAAKGCVADSCKIIDGTSSFTTGISVVGGGSNLADGCKITDCYLESAGATNGILINEVDDQVVISGNTMMGSFSTAGVQNATGHILTNLAILGNAIGNTGNGAKCLNIVSACTGLAMNNYTQNGNATTINTITGLLAAGNIIA